jgi:acetyl esterase/lipase
MAATRRVQANGRVLIDLRYGSDYWQKLDVYLPRVSDVSGVPVLLFFHGGAWTSGTKEWMGFMAPTLLSIPAIYVAANYRLAPVVRYPEIVDDCAAATAWVQANISKYGGDPGRLFVGGHSAGGHLAALVALDRDCQRRAGLAKDSIRACLNVSGSYDIRNRGAAVGSAERRIYDVLLRDERDDSAASPITHVQSDSVPFFVAWGERDFPRLVSQARSFSAALEHAGARVQTLELKDRDHFEANEACGIADGQWAEIASRWLSVKRPGANE